MTHGLASMREFRRHARREAPIIRRAERIWPMVLAWGFLALVFGGTGALVVVITFESGENGPFWAGLGIIAFAFVLLGSIVAVAISNARRWWTRRAAAALALARGWHFELEVDPSFFRGTLFSAGTRGRVETAMHTHDPRMIEVGNYTFMADAGRSLKGVDQIGYVRMVLNNELPHMYLQAQGRTRPRPYEVAFDRARRIDLEGDFVQYWRLCVPPGHEQDAYYVFTPDLMQTLVDVVPGFDVEIIGTEMYLYAPGRFDLTRADVLEAADLVGRTVGARTAHRSSRFTDLVGGSVPRLGNAATWTLRLVPAVVVSAVLIAVAWQVGVLA